MRKSQLTKHLNELNDEELKSEIMLLFDKVEGVRKFYAMELGSDSQRQKVYERIKKDIVAKYATKSFRKPRRPRIQKINKILSEMRKTAIFQHEMADLYLFDVETAIVFSIRYGFFSKVLVNHILGVFQKACDIIHDQKIYDMFKDRIDLIVERSILIPEIHKDLRRISSVL